MTVLKSLFASIAGSVLMLLQMMMVRIAVTKNTVQRERLLRSCGGMISEN